MGQILKGSLNKLVNTLTYTIESYSVSVVSLKAGWPSAFLGFHLPLVSIMTCSVYAFLLLKRLMVVMKPSIFNSFLIVIKFSFRF